MSVYCTCKQCGKAESIVFLPMVPQSSGFMQRKSLRESESNEIIIGRSNLLSSKSYKYGLWRYFDPEGLKTQNLLQNITLGERCKHLSLTCWQSGVEVTGRDYRYFEINTGPSDRLLLIQFFIATYSQNLHRSNFPFFIRFYVYANDGVEPVSSSVAFFSNCYTHF